jgi:hypothetical protein
MYCLSNYIKEDSVFKITKTFYLFSYLSFQFKEFPLHLFIYLELRPTHPTNTHTGSIYEVLSITNTKDTFRSKTLTPKPLSEIRPELKISPFHTLPPYLIKNQLFIKFKFMFMFPKLLNTSKFSGKIFVTFYRAHLRCVV